MERSLSIVIPVYNSEKTLRTLTEKLTMTLRKLCSQYEIILVDDGSRDKSYARMLELHAENKNIKIIQLSRNYGQQNAILCGLQHAQGEWIVTMDDDLQHPPEEIEKLIVKLKEGYDVVYGIPIKKKHSFFRNFGTSMTHLLFHWICGKPGNIRISSFRIMKRELVKEIVQYKSSFVYISAIIFKVGGRAGNVRVQHKARQHGRSNYSIVKLLKLYIKLFVHYSSFKFTYPDLAKEGIIIRSMHL